MSAIVYTLLYWLLSPLPATPANKPSASTLSGALTAGFEALDGATGFRLGGAGVEITFKPGGVAVLEVPHAGSQVSLEFLGADRNRTADGEGAYIAPVRYYVGTAEQWRNTIRYRRIRYRDLYPGIDLVFRSSEDGVEFDIEVGPERDVHQVRMRWNGLTNLTLDVEGGIVGLSERLRVRQAPPNNFQKIAGTDRLRWISSTYRVTSQNVVHFDLADYDEHAALTLDPSVAISTHVGGSSTDTIYGTAVDSSGNIYIAGETSSADFRGISIASADAFVMKLDPTGTRTLYLTFLGGSAYDSARAIAVDSEGNAYVAGITNSTNFPVVGALQGSSGGPPDAFVVKLNASGQIVYSTYLGGSGADYGFGIAIDSTGAAYVSGQTTSINLPTTSGTSQSRFGGGLSDCFIAKLSASGNALAYMTFLGGSGLDVCTAVAVDGSGNVTVAGTTSSHDFPLVSALQITLMGSSDAFIAGLNPAGSAFLFSTYLGGNSVDAANSVALDSSNNIYVAGATASTDFPATPGAFQLAQKGMYNAFVCKLPPSGLSLSYCTLLGGEASDTATSMAVAPTGEAIVAGYTSSTQFPIVQATDPSFGGAFDGFIALLNPAGSGLDFSTYAGGSGDDRFYSVAVNGTTAYAGGWTSTAGHNGSYDGLLFAVSGLPLSSSTIPAYLNLPSIPYNSGDFTFQATTSLVASGITVNGTANMTLYTGSTGTIYIEPTTDIKATSNSFRFDAKANVQLQ
jgi:hypothetical protein